MRREGGGRGRERGKGERGGGKGMSEESAKGDCWEGITPVLDILHTTLEQVGTVNS